MIVYYSMNFGEILFEKPILAHGACIGLIGGGGKTTLLYRLGYDLAQSHRRVLLTSLTKAGHSPEYPIHYWPLSGDPDDWFKERNPIYVLAKQLAPEKYEGLTTAQLEQLLPHLDVCVAEADGARRHPLKAHNDRDLYLPSCITHVIILVGAEVVNRPLNEKWVHRPELFQKLWGLPSDERLTPDIIASVVTHPKGYRSRLNPSTSTVYFINQADVFPEQAKTLASTMLNYTTEPVFYGSVREKWWKLVQ